MRIISGSITTLAREGRVTTQVPEFVIGGVPDYVTIPDAWVVRLATEDGEPARRGFLFLSRAGWTANQNAIRDAWLASPVDRRRANNWSEACARIEAIFQRRDVARQKAVTRLKKKIAWLNGVQL